MQIYITRHGQDEDNVDGILNGHRDKPLTELGIQQAKNLAQKILELNIKFDAIFTSPLQRAYKTGLIISEALKLDPPTKVNLLIERNFGAMTGKLISQVEELCSPHTFPGNGFSYMLRPDGGETFPDLLKRGKQALEYFQKNYSDKQNILLVTHGDIGKMIYAAFYDLDWKDVLTNFHFGNSDLLLLSESITPDEAHILQNEQHNF
jgi:broad specificity phosphatase PhoE